MLLGAFLALGCSEKTGLVLRQESEVDASVVGDAASEKPELTPDAANASDAADVIVDACNTCSGSIALTNPLSSMLWGGDGGKRFAPDTCGTGEAVIGYLGTVNGNTLVNNDASVSVIGSIQTICGHMVSDDSATTVTWVPSTLPPLPTRGTATTMPWATQCNTDEVVVALRGGYGDAFDQIDVVCGKLQISTANGARIVTVDPAAGRLAGNAGGDGFTVSYDFPCGPNKVVIGSEVHAGTLIDAFGVTCATPTFVPFDGGAKCCGLGMHQVSQPEDSSVSTPPAR